MAQPRIAQACKQAPVAAITDLLIEQQSEPFGMSERCGFRGCFDLAEGFGHALEAELMKQVEGWMGKQGWSPNGSSGPPLDRMCTAIRSPLAKISRYGR